MSSPMHRSGDIRQLELFVTEPLLQPEHDLNRLFHVLNWKHWGGRLQYFHCEWSDRMITTWGACYRGKRLIRISTIFRDRPAEEVVALLCHEMIHIRYGGHGKRFRQELKRIGLEGDIQRKFPHLVKWTESLRRSLRYTYVCRLCGIQIKRRRKIHGFCAACHRKGIRSKFKLM